MSTSSGDGVTGAVPGGTPTPEGVFDVDLVSRIANEFYADTPPHEPESAVLVWLLQAATGPLGQRKVGGIIVPLRKRDKST